MPRATIRKALWGQGNDLDRRAARKPLRDSLAVADDSPLLDVQMRNRFEHFDEYLDDWHKRGGSGYADLNIGLVFDFDKNDVFRSYNPKTRTLTFLDLEFKVQDIVDEARRILTTSSQELWQRLPESLRPVVDKRNAQGAGTAG